jgi:hypothetical protein
MATSTMSHYLARNNIRYFLPSSEATEENSCKQKVQRDLGTSSSSPHESPSNYPTARSAPLLRARTFWRALTRSLTQIKVLN